jgi:predicted RNA-binding protein with PUA-like domain
MVEIRLFQIFPEPVPIGTLRATKGLARMELVRKGSRLSVQPVRPGEFEIIMRLARAPGMARKLKTKAKPAARKVKRQSKARTAR